MQGIHVRRGLLQALVSSLLFQVLPFVSLFALAGGLLWRAACACRSHRPGVGAAPDWKSSLTELLFFRGLLRTGVVPWALVWALHVCLGLALVRHLRYFLYPVPGWVVALQGPGTWAGFALPPLLVCLLLRRACVSRAVEESGAEDYFALVLLLTIAVTGVLMRFAFRQDVVAVKAAALALAGLRVPAGRAGGSLFAAHFLLVNVLAIYFPFSRLLHAPGLSLGLAVPRPWEAPDKKLRIARRGGAAGASAEAAAGPGLRRPGGRLGA